jgi:electron transfer flavoprotein beta subunit
VYELEVAEDAVRAKRQLEDGYEVIEAKLPALLTITKDANKPRYPTAPGIISAYRSQEVIQWTSEDLDVEAGTVGLEGSPTQVRRSFSPPAKEPGETVTLPPDEAAKEVIRRLKAQNIIRG